jgi:hypothetical protein
MAHTKLNQSIEPSSGEKEHSLSLDGYIDLCTERLIGGWAWDSQHPERRLDVEILVYGRPVGRASAKHYREDLERAGIGDGRYGFFYTLPFEIQQDAQRTCAIVAGTDVFLPRTQTIKSPPDDTAILVGCGPSPEAPRLIGRVDYADPSCVIGWAALVDRPPPCPKPIRPVLLVKVDGSCIAEISPEVRRGDLQPLFNSNISFGFHFCPAGIRIPWGALISVTDRGGQHLPGSPVRLEPPETAWLGYNRRIGLACHYLSGEGIEVGALHSPMPVPPGVRVKYIDRMSVIDLRRHYPELGNADLLDPDIITDGQTLAGIGDLSQEFLIANHVVEHFEDPIGFIKNLLRVLKPAGIGFLSVPDKRYTFDRDRPITPLDHLITDHEMGPHISQWDHYLEWAALDGLSGEELISRARLLREINYSIHFHVWDLETFASTLLTIKDTYSLPFTVEMFCSNGPEFIVILKKLTPSAPLYSPHMPRSCGLGCRPPLSDDRRSRIFNRVMGRTCRHELDVKPDIREDFPV